MDLLQTKLHYPKFESDRLFHRELAGKITGCRSRVILISGPAGYGKTSLIAEVLNGQWKNSSYLSLDQFDNNPLRFWNYFAGSIRELYPDFGRAFLALLDSERSEEIEQYLIPLINDLAAVDKSLYIVLDDFHLIEEKSICRGLDFLIDNLPPDIHLVLVTREDPPLALSRLRVSGQLTEVRQDDLRFTPEELKLFFRLHPGIDLSDEQQELIFRKTEGWPAGILLAQLALQGCSDRQDFIRRFDGSSRYIFEYLLDEVFLNIDQETADFLTRTSVFSEFNSEMCNTYLTVNNSEEVLRNLQADNLFIISVDNAGQWFRYHNLFREFLKTRLFSGLNEKQRNDLHIKASSVLAAFGEYEEAFSEYIKAGACQQAADLLEKIIPGYYRDGRHRFISEAIAKLPEELVCKNPTIYALRYWSETLQAREFKDRFTGETNQFLEGIKLLSRGYLAFLRNRELTVCIDFVGRALKVLPEQYRELINTAKLIISISYFYSGDLERAEQYCSFDLSEDRYYRRFYSAVLQDMNRIEHCFERAEFKKAERMLNDTCTMINNLSGGFNPAAASYLRLEWSYIYLYTNNPQQALEAADQALAMNRYNTMEEVNLLTLEHKGAVQLYLGEHQECRETWEYLASISRESSAWVHSRAKAYLARLDMHLKRKPSVWAEKFRKKNSDVFDGEESPYTFFEELLVYAEYLVFNREYEKAVRLLHKMVRSLVPGKMIVSAIRCTILEACIMYRYKNISRATALLEQVLKWMDGEEPAYFFLASDSSIIPLLEEADRQIDIPVYLLSFLKKPGSEKKKTVVEIYNCRETFNDREISILELMAKGLSNQEICDTIFLSINTVRWYARQLYLKLDVKRRGEAVARATELGLI